MNRRMAMRAALQERDVTTVVIMTSLPRMDDETPTIEPPDSVKHYQARDGSIVEVIRREYAPGKFTAFIYQTWQDGSTYHGNCMLDSFAELEKTCRQVPLQTSVWGVANGHA